MTDLDKIISLEKLSRYHANVTDLIDSKVNKLVAIDDIRLNMLKMDGDGSSFLANDGTYKTLEIPSLEVVQQMIDDTTANLHIYCTNDDILRLFDTNTPEEPEPPVDPEPDEPDTPEEPIGDFGIITNDNSIIIDETQLENGKYTLRYIDSNDNIINNFNEITTFEINN
jgi:hypothetical protein